VKNEKIQITSGGGIFDSHCIVNGWNRMVSLPMMSRDPERWRSWPSEITKPLEIEAWGPVSRKRLEIETCWQWSTCRKWPIVLF